MAWPAWKTASDLEAANTDELVGNALYWSTTLAPGDAELRSQPDRIYLGRLETHAYAAIKRGTTYADYSFDELSVSGSKLFYLLSFSGDEQGASVSIGYQTIAGPTRSCQINGLGTDFDPDVPRSFLLGVAASGLATPSTATRDVPTISRFAFTARPPAG